MKSLASMRLIHYGSLCYDPKKFKPISNVTFRNVKFRTKPEGGFWTSPVNSKYGWSDWCKDESYSDLTESFEVDFNGTVFTVNSISDMKKLPWKKDKDMPYISFEDMTCDAIHLTVQGERETRYSEPSLYGWDCESVLVMNPECITAG